MQPDTRSTVLSVPPPSPHQSIGPPGLRAASPYVVAARGSPLLTQLLDEAASSDDCAPDPSLNATTASAQPSAASTLRFPKTTDGLDPPSSVRSAPDLESDLDEASKVDFETANDLLPPTRPLTHPIEIDQQLATDIVQVEIHGAQIEYHLDRDDVASVFERLTTVHNVFIDPEAPSKAIVSVTAGTGADVVRLLDGQKLQGIEGTLSAVQVNPQAQTLIDLFLKAASETHGTADAVSLQDILQPPKDPTAESSSDGQYLNLLLDLYRNGLGAEENKSATDPLWPPPEHSIRRPSSMHMSSPGSELGLLSLPRGPLGYATPASYGSDFEPVSASPFGTPGSTNYFAESCSPWADSNSVYLSSGHRYAAESLRHSSDVQSPGYHLSCGGGIHDSAAQRSSAGASANETSACARSKTRKWTARYDIQIDPDEAFQVTRRIIGNRGANMKKINQMTGAKLRLRGQGSGYLEGSSRQEADDPLHLCISCCDANKYKMAKHLTEKLLKAIYADYDTWVSEQGGVPPRLHIRFRELFLPTRNGGCESAETLFGSPVENAFSQRRTKPRH